VDEAALTTVLAGVGTCVLEKVLKKEEVPGGEKDGVPGRRGGGRDERR
jgi:hypothetical protein